MPAPRAGRPPVAPGRPPLVEPAAPPGQRNHAGGQPVGEAQLDHRLHGLLGWQYVQQRRHPQQAAAFRVPQGAPDPRQEANGSDATASAWRIRGAGIAARRGITMARSPVDERVASPAAACGPTRRRESSSATRSRDTRATTASAPGMASRVVGANRKPSWETNRAPRRGRSPSSANRSRGSPTARITFRARSARPSNGSRSSPWRGSQAMALTVKSRRARSASRLSWKVTRLGRRPST